MVEGMKIMATSFKGFHASTAARSAPNPAAGHCQPAPPPETPTLTLTPRLNPKECREVILYFFFFPGMSCSSHMTLRSLFLLSAKKFVLHCNHS